MSDNTRRPFNPSPAAVELARNFAQYAAVEGFITSHDVIIAVKSPRIRNQAQRVYETFFNETGNGTSAFIQGDCVEIKMPKTLYDQRFTPVC